MEYLSGKTPCFFSEELEPGVARSDMENSNEAWTFAV